MSDVNVATVAPAKSDDAALLQGFLVQINNVRAEIKKLDGSHRLAKSLVKSPKDIDQGKKLLEDCKSTLKALQESAKATGGEPPQPTNDASGSPGASEDSDMAKRSNTSKKSKTNARKPVKGKTTKAKGEAKPRGPNAESAAGKIAAFMLSHKTATSEKLAQVAGVPLKKVDSRVRAASADHLVKLHKQKLIREDGKWVLAKAS